MQPSILIISDDVDYYPVLQEQCQLQLGASCTQVVDSVQAKKQYRKHDVVLNDGQVVIEDFPCPVLDIREKPLRLQDLLAEIQALVHKASSPDALALGCGCVLYVQSKQLVYEPSGKMVDITDKELQLLKALAGSGMDGISREQLLKDVWGFGEKVDTHTLETHIYRLRSKLKDVSGRDDLIQAMDGGYRMIDE